MKPSETTPEPTIGKRSSIPTSCAGCARSSFDCGSVDSSGRGGQQTPAAGHTREFKDHRSYTTRDDFRTIDWSLFARLEKLFVRVFEEVQEFQVHVLIDASASMRDPFPEKRRSALRLGVALAYLALMNQHRVSIGTFSTQFRREIPPRRGQGHIHDMLNTLTQLEFAGETDYERSLREFRPGRDRRSIVFLISDFLGADTESVPRALSSMRWSCETHLIQTLHPNEVRPDLEGELQLVDVESGEDRRLSFSARELRRYEAVFQEYMNTLRDVCRQRRVDYLVYQTDESFESVFLDLLSRGSSLASS